MISKEWRDAWWKLVVAAAGALPALLWAMLYLPPYQNTGRIMERFTDKVSVEQVLNVYGGGGVALSLFAILLGAMSVSEEVARGTMFLLLSRPVSRTRVFLCKYAFSAGLLLLAAAVGHALLIVVAVAKGYPLHVFSLYGVVLSTLLMWLGSLLAFGVATTFSVVFRSSLVSLAVAFVVVFLCIYALPVYVGGFVPFGILTRVVPPYSWTSAGLYAGEGFASLNFLASATIGGFLLLLPLWLFNRKAY